MKCVGLLIFTRTPTRPSCTIALLMSPLFYTSAVISLISTRNEGRIKTRINSMFYINIFLWVLRAKGRWVCLICPEWGMFRRGTSPASHTLWTETWGQRGQKVWLSFYWPFPTILVFHVHFKVLPMNTEGQLHIGTSGRCLQVSLWRVGGRLTEAVDASSLPLLMGCACKWACPDWPGVQVPVDVTGIIILLCSRVNTNNTAPAVFLNCANFSCSFASVWLLSGDWTLSAVVSGSDTWVNLWGWEASKQPVCWSCKWLPGCVRSVMARGRGSTRRGEWSYLGGALYAVWILFLALYE